MAYGTRWEHHRAAECQAAAEKRCGPAPLGYLYRFMEHTYASSDPWGDDDNWTFSTYLELEAFPIVRKTPKGWSIKERAWEHTRFVSEYTTKQFALPTIDEALKSYIARKNKQASIYQARADNARRMIEIAQKGLFNDLPIVHGPRVS